MWNVIFGLGVGLGGRGLGVVRLEHASVTLDTVLNIRKIATKGKNRLDNLRIR